MHRLGFSTEDKDKILAAFSLKHIKVAGIFTHLCAADSLEENDVAFTNKQIGSFYKVLDWLKNSGLNIPKVHIQSSYGLLNYPELECDYIRVGVALYGVLSSTNDKTKLELDLRPVLSLKYISTKNDFDFLLSKIFAFRQFIIVYIVVFSNATIFISGNCDVG